MNKAKKLKPKEKKLVKAVIQGKSQPQAFAEAGYAVPKTDNRLS